MLQTDADTTEAVVEVVNPAGSSPVVLVCEHASAFMPPQYDNLGLAGDVLTSHAAWDPGARAVALEMSRHLDAVLVASKISRLVYDCNRPLSAEAATPARSEVFDIPGNLNLSQAERQARHDDYYLPFHRAVAGAMQAVATPILVTMHSFTPVYHGTRRAVEIGLLHDADSRLTDAMLACAAAHTPHIVRRNEPYGPADGVTHTVAQHATPRGCPSVMIEVRNDLIAIPDAQADMGRRLAGWLAQATGQLNGTAP